MAQYEQRIRISGDTAGLEAAVTRAVGSLARIEAAAKQGAAGLEPLQRLPAQVEGVRGSVDRLRGSFLGVAAGAAALLTLPNTLGGITRGAIDSADAMTNMRARLGLVTAGSGQLIAAQERLYRIAQSTRSSFEDLGGAYFQIAKSSAQLGTKQSDLLDVTEAVAQAMALSGGEARSMNAALIQLGQGLASGQLRGEELNSVFEQTPRLAKAIADGLGTTLGGLRAMSEQGKLTTEVVLGAIKKSAPALAAEFARIPPTIMGAFQTVRNAGTNLIATMDQASGASRSLAGGLQSLAGGLDSVGKTIASHKEGFATLGNLASGAAGGVALAGALGGVALALRGIGLAFAAHPVVAAFLLGSAALGAGINVIARQSQAQAENLDNIRARIESVGSENATDQARVDQLKAHPWAGKGVGIEGQIGAIEARIQARTESLRGLTEEFRAAQSKAAQALAGGLDTRAEDARMESGANKGPFPGAPSIEEAAKSAKIRGDILKQEHEDALKITRSYQQALFQLERDFDPAASAEERNAAKARLEAEFGQRLIANRQESELALKAFDERGLADQQRLADARAGVAMAGLQKTAAQERAALEERRAATERERALELIGESEYRDRLADLGREEIALQDKLLEREIAATRARKALRPEDALERQKKLLDLERQRIDLAARAATLPRAGDFADQQAAQGAFEQRRQSAEALAASAMAAEQSLADLRAEVGRGGAEMIADEEARARALLALQVQGERERLGVIFEGIAARAGAEAEFEATVIARQAQLADRFKPGWQKLVEGWRDTQRLMKEASAEFTEGFIRQGEDAFVELNKTGKLNIQGLLDFMRDSLARTLYRSAIAEPMAELGNSIAGAAKGLWPSAQNTAQQSFRAGEILAQNAAEATLAAQTGATTGALVAFANMGVEPATASVVQLGLAARDAALALASVGGGSGGGLLGSLLGGGSDLGTTGDFARMDRLLPSANGNAFDHGIVSTPTLFKFASGGAFRRGLMGEAGPEGILPLERGPGGRLGVRSYGGGAQQAPVNIEIINNGPPVSARTERKSDGGVRVIIDQVLDAVAGDFDRNGRVARSAERRLGGNSVNGAPLRGRV